MGKIKKIVALSLIAVASMSFAGCKMIQKTPEAVQKETLAKVGDKKITRQEITDKMANTYKYCEQQYGSDYKNNEQVKTQLLSQEKQVLQELVDTQIILQEAEKNNWVEPEDKLNKEVDEQFKQTKSVYKSDEAFKNAYEQSGFKDESEVKKWIKEQTIINEALNEHVYDISDNAVKEYYDKNKNEYKVDKDGAIVYNIVISGDNAKEKAEQVRQEIIDKKTTFEKMAAKYNTDSTKSTGGLLGYVAYDSTNHVSGFIDAVKKLKDGEISEPVKTEYGYHLIKVSKVLKKGDFIPFNYAKDEIKDKLKDEAYDRNIAKWKEDLKVKVYEDRLQ